jgi:hypothetical protein
MIAIFEVINQMLETRIAKIEDDPFLCEVYCSTRIDEVSAWCWEENDRNAFLSTQWIIQKTPINFSSQMLRI